MNREVQRYLDAVPEDRKVLIETLHASITDLYPDAGICMSCKVPTYRARLGWVAIANQKRYVSLYTCYLRRPSPGRVQTGVPRHQDRQRVHQLQGDRSTTFGIAGESHSACYRATEIAATPVCGGLRLAL